MDSTDEQLVRLGRFGRQLPIGIAAVGLLLLVAILKPWPTGRSSEPIKSTSPPVVVAGASGGAPSPSGPVDRAGAMCADPAGWRVVADDVELGRSVRTWLVAAVLYSAALPVRSTIPVTVLVSNAVSSLGFCVPADLSGAGTTSWSGTLWRQGGDTADPTALQQVARLTPLPDSLGALADPLHGSVVAWPPGHYVLEARFDGSTSEAWLGLVIQDAP